MKEQICTRQLLMEPAFSDKLPIHVCKHTLTERASRHNRALHLNCVPDDGTLSQFRRPATANSAKGAESLFVPTYFQHSA